MRVGNYSLVIPEGVERDSGYVGLPHGRQYTIRCMSHECRRADAEVEVDGKPVGVFRLDVFGSVVLERSRDDHGRFTFYADATDDARKAGLEAIAVPDRGLVRVTFRPEKRVVVPRQPSVVRSMWLSKGPGGQSQCYAGPERTYTDRLPDEKTVGGVTGLSGHSGQQFVNVGPIDYDPLAAVTITVRLVLRHDGPRPLAPAARQVAANPVPSPV